MDAASEWLETNGTGAFAMGTAAGMNTRRYHGLLVASRRPPVERFVALSRLEETVEVGGRRVELGVNQYPGAVHPRGDEHLQDFRLDPLPTWTYRVGAVTLRRTVFLVQGEQTVIVRYTSDGSVRLQLHPLIAFRDYHSLTHANEGLDSSLEIRTPFEDTREVVARPYSGLPALRLQFEGSIREEGKGWYYRTQYREEAARGLDFEEDLWCLGTVELAMRGGSAFLVASIEASLAEPNRAALEALESTERKRRTPNARARSKGQRTVALLSGAADAFLAQRADGKPTIIAGYPWFTDWGRDAMISLPGLLLARGRVRETEDVLRGFLAHMDQGLIPNRFPDAGERAEYNTADATLWMFHVAGKLASAGGDDAFLRDELYPALADSVRWHTRGTHHGIRVDPADGLLVAGGPGTQLTWMDAKVGDQVMTPRHGKPVEINALWFNALKVMEALARRFGDTAAATSTAERATQVAESFSRAFWSSEQGCLLDVIRPDGGDPAIRPNQIFAVSLPHSPLSEEQMRAVVRTVESALLTPYGLRTLAADEVGYRGRYRGDAFSRDSAYHQGTVWPWLLGPYIDAYLRVFGRGPDARAHCRALLEPLERHLEEGCLGQVSEVFDGDAPHTPGGAPAQAWSVAELLRLHLEAL